MKRIGGFMCRIFHLLLAIEFGVAILPAALAGSVEISAASYPSSVSRELLEAYLHFHDEEICRGVDAVFISNENGIEVWSRVEDEGQYKKLLKLLKPLYESGRVEMHTTVPSSENEESDEADSLPPSLWENNELRNHLWMPLLGSRTFINSEISMFVISPEEILKQRLMIFSEQTQNQSKLVKRYAADLPTLTRIALDPAVESDLRFLAKKVSKEHSKSLEKQIGKLEKNLKYALPRGENNRESDLRDAPIPAGEDLADLAVQISENARSISRHVYLFIYPDCYTVKLDELRNPDLLKSLRVLYELNDAYIEKIDRISVKY